MLRYVTTNAGKVREAEEYLGDGISQLDYDYTEIQSDDLGTIAARGAREAYRHAGEPTLVDDAGLFVRALDGFPGPYSSYAEDTINLDGGGGVGLASDAHVVPHEGDERRSQVLVAREKRNDRGQLARAIGRSPEKESGARRDAHVQGAGIEIRRQCGRGSPL